MNERIRELVRQAGLYDADFPVENWDNVPLEKFAELIVKECDSIMQKYSKANMESDSWVEMISMMQKELQKHFGVEE